MEHHPYSTGRAGWHLCTGIVLTAFGLAFVAGGVVSGVAAIADDFLVFLWASAFFTAMGLLGMSFGLKGARATRRLRTTRYGITIDGDEVRSLEFDPWGDRESTFRWPDVERSKEHLVKYHLYLHVVLRDGSHRWLPTWRMDPRDREQFFARLGVGGPGPAARGADTAASTTAPRPTTVRPPTVDAGPAPAAPAAVVATTTTAVRTEDRGAVHASARTLQVAAAWLATIDEVLGVRVLEVAERAGGGVFRFGHDEDERDAPWLEVRTLGSFPATADSGAIEWRDRLVLCNARDEHGRLIDLEVDSEMLADAGWWWDARSRTLDPAVLTRCRERFAARHTGREPVPADWRWLLDPAERDRP